MVTHFYGPQSLTSEALPKPGTAAIQFVTVMIERVGPPANALRSVMFRRHRTCGELRESDRHRHAGLLAPISGARLAATAAQCPVSVVADIVPYE